jgi:hypothetical protein
MDRPTPNNGYPYKPVYRGGFEIPSVRVRLAVRAAEQREARWKSVEDVVCAVIEAVVVAVTWPWMLVMRRAQ